MFQRGLWPVWFKSCAHLQEMESSPVDLHGLNRVIMKLEKRSSSEEGNVCRQTMCTSSAGNVSGQKEHVIDKKIKIRMYLVISKFFVNSVFFYMGSRFLLWKFFSCLFICLTNIWTPALCHHYSLHWKYRSKQNQKSLPSWSLHSSETREVSKINYWNT